METKLLTPPGKVENREVAKLSAEPKAAIAVAIRAAIPVCIPLKQRRMNTITAMITMIAEPYTFVIKVITSFFLLSSLCRSLLHQLLTQKLGSDLNRNLRHRVDGRLPYSSPRNAKIT
jgi:hypothetical protein